jgi:hypothetical protein
MFVPFSGVILFLPRMGQISVDKKEMGFAYEINSIFGTWKNAVRSVYGYGLFVAGGL